MVDRPLYFQLIERAHGRDMMDVLDIGILPGLAEKVHQKGVAILGIKCGKLGFFLSARSGDRLERMGRGRPEQIEAWADREFFCETFVPDTVLSTTGSGDSSIAGFIAALLAGRSAAESVRVACAAGANTARVYDALSGVDTLQAMEDRIAEGWKRNALTYASNRWIFDESESLWKQAN